MGLLEWGVPSLLLSGCGFFVLFVVFSCGFFVFVGVCLLGVCFCCGCVVLRGCGCGYLCENVGVWGII